MLSKLRHSLTTAWIVAYMLLSQLFVGAYFTTAMAVGNTLDGRSFAFICSSSSSSSFIAVDANGLPLLDQNQPTQADHSLLCQAYCSVFSSNQDQTAILAATNFTPLVQSKLYITLDGSDLPPSFLLADLRNRSPPVLS